MARRALTLYSRLVHWTAVLVGREGHPPRRCGTPARVAAAFASCLREGACDPRRQRCSSRSAGARRSVVELVLTQARSPHACAGGADGAAPASRFQCRYVARTASAVRGARRPTSWVGELQGSGVRGPGHTIVGDANPVLGCVEPEPSRTVGTRMATVEEIVVELRAPSVDEVVIEILYAEDPGIGIAAGSCPASVDADLAHAKSLRRVPSGLQARHGLRACPITADEADALIKAGGMDRRG
jgi:hypothetical protein